MEAKFVPKIAFEALDLRTPRGMIAAGIGIGVLPRSPVRVAGIVEIKLSQPQIVHPLGISWIEERYLPPCAAVFRDFVTSRLPSNSLVCDATTNGAYVNAKCHAEAISTPASSRSRPISLCCLWFHV
jgi:hypothetical protein